MAPGESGRALAIVAALAAVALAPACAQRLGEQTAKGVVEGLRSQATEDPNEQPTRVAATRAIIAR